MPSRSASCGDELRRLVGVARVQRRSSRGSRAARRCPRAPSATGRPRRSRRRRASRSARAWPARSRAMRTKSYARERNAANVDTNGVQPRTCMPDRGRDELLLGDEHLEVAVRVRLAEVLGVRRVRDLAVERDDVAADVGQRGDRLAVGLAGGDLVAELVGRQRAAGRLEDVRLAGLAACATSTDQVALAAELRDRRLGVVERLAVLAGLVLDRLDALALLGLGDDRDRLAVGVPRPRRRRPRSPRRRGRRSRSPSSRRPRSGARSRRGPSRASSRASGRAG